MDNLLTIREKINDAKRGIIQSRQMLHKQSKEDIRLGEILLLKNLTTHENNLIEMENILSNRSYHA